APVDNVQQAATPTMEEEKETSVSRDTSAGTGDGARATTMVPAPAATQRYEEGERQRISPLVRRLAHEHDIDLSGIAGTGTGGRVRKGDILAYIAQQQAQPAAAQAATATQVAQPTTTMPQPVAAQQAGATARPAPAAMPMPV